MNQAWPPWPTTTLQPPANISGRLWALMPTALFRRANLWLGDACYALGKYAEAEKAYTDYLSADRRGENRTLAIYNRLTPG